MRKLSVIIAVCFVLLLIGCDPAEKKRELMWDVDKLYQLIPDSWDAGVFYAPNVKGIYFQGETFKDEETNIYAYIGVPTTPMPEGGYPAIVLIHGGLGKAFGDWVKMWTDKGYVAIAPDFDAQMSTPVSGAYQTVNNPLGGPKGYGVRTEDLIGNKKDSWVYQSVSNIIRANNLLRNMDIVDKTKIGATGISWGSYLLGITLGVDQRFAFAMPVYGAGYLDEDFGSSLYGMFAGMDDEMIKTYREFYDPAAYLKANITPTFWMQGVTDYAFSPVAKQKAIDHIKGVDIQYAYLENMTHGQEQGSAPKELFAFADSIVENTDSILKIKSLNFNDSQIIVESTNDIEIVSARLFWTDSPDYEIHQATWYREEVSISGGIINASVPSGALYAFIEITDSLGNKVSSRFYEVI